MEAIEKLADYDHPLLRKTAKRLTSGEKTVRDKLEKLFYFVRDDIRFGFLPDWDLVKASDVIKHGIGYCNLKSTLFLALCKAVSIPARVHYSHIKSEIMKGIFPGLALAFFPRKGPHSWLEVEVDGKWRKIDSYINDKELFLASKRKLEEKGWEIGYSVACPEGKCSCEFNIDKEEFVHMGAVVEDHGVWDDPADYFMTDKYKVMSAVNLFFFRLLVDRVNKNIEQIRKGSKTK